MKDIDLLNDLTKKQIEAVTHNKGPILVVAGAGTGKTTVITRRISWLITKKYAKPEEILALTFTEKAATEMITRVDELSDYIYSGLNISTFHSFGSDIISEFAFELGLTADIRVLTDVEQVLFIKDHIFDFEFYHYQNLADPTSLIKELIKTFSRLKDESISPDEFISNAKKQIKSSKTVEDKENAEKQVEMANAYKTYNKLLREEGYIDYGDQINLVLELMKKPSCAKKIRDKFKYALIDEFQDTNYVQSKLIFEIFGKNGNVMVVGDDDQSIYKFRGAAISNILNFREQYEKVKTVILSDNFRSTQNILDASYKLIQNNNPNRLEAKYNISKKLKSHLPNKEDPKLILCETESQEAEVVAEEIIKKNKNGLNFGDIAILFRANRHAEEFIRTLKKHSIPFIFSGAEGLYQKLEVKMLVSLISALYNPEDDLATFHLASSDVYNMNADDLVQISGWARKRNRPLQQVFTDLFSLSEQLSLFPETIDISLKIVDDLSNLRQEAKTSTAGEVVNLFLKESGYYSKLTHLAKDGSIEAHNKITNIASFFDKIIHFQRNYKDHSLQKFAEYLELILDAGDDPKPFEITDGVEAVNILTIHKAKGLEFDTVFISSLSDSHFPGADRKDKLPFPDELLKEKADMASGTEEERRLFYVASTRAKNSLFFTAALDYGTKRTHKISRFIIETLGLTGIEQRFLKTEAIDKVRHFDKLPTLYGTKIEPIPDSEKIILSRAAIDDYLTCPFKYQLIHVTPIRIVADATVAYGTAIHNTIGEYYKRKMSGSDVKLSEVYEWFELFWDEAGFLSRIHEKKRYESGKNTLKLFYETAEKSPLPTYLEKEFKFPIGNNIIKGRYDAVYESKDKTEIIDYKTSKITNQEKADDRTKKSSQLEMYALSWKIINNKLPDAVKLYFVESGIVGTFTPTEKSIEKTIKNINIATEGIRKRDYHATPKYDKCPYCPFKFYCPVAITEKVSS